MYETFRILSVYKEKLPSASAESSFVTVTGFDDGEVDSVWADEPGVYKWKLEDAWMFDEPILNVKGKLNLFDYDIDENNQEELEHNGYFLWKGNELKDFKLHFIFTMFLPP